MMIFKSDVNKQIRVILPYVVIALCSSLLSIFVFFAVTFLPKNNTSKTIEIVESPEPSIVPTPTVSTSVNTDVMYPKDDLMNRELKKFQEKTYPNLISNVFSFKTRTIDSNWIFSSMNYKDDGLDIYISQVGCKVKSNVFPDTSYASKCLDELDHREYPHYALNNILLSVGIITPPENYGNPIDVISIEKKDDQEIGLTQNKRQYLLKNDGGTYTFTFFSKKLLKEFSMAGPLVYGKYDLVISPNSEVISKEKTIQLGERIIDSIEFL